MAQRMSSGVELPIKLKTVITISQAVTSKDYTFQVTRGLSRSVGIFVTQSHKDADDGTAKDKFQFYYPIQNPQE